MWNFIMGVNWSVIIVCYFLGISFNVAGSRQKDKYKSAPQVVDIDFPQNLVSLEGDRLKLPCKVIGSPRPFKIWYKDQRQLSAKYDNRFKFGRYALTIDPVEKNDSGIYNCHVENGLGELWINFTVKVLTEEEVEDYDGVEYDDPDGKCQEGPPIFKDKTKEEWIARPEMSPVEIKCVACGKPKPTIKWFKDKQFIDPGVTGGRYNVREYELKIDRLLKSDEGNYTCVVENDLGKLNFTYKLEVLISRISKPVIVGPVTQTVQTGSDARFECKVLGNVLQHHTQWLHHYTVNGSYRDDEGQPYVNIIQQSMVNVSQPDILIIKNVTKVNAGWYTCLVSNPMGKDYQSAWLVVIGKGLAVNGVCDRNAISACFSGMVSSENMQAQCAAYENIKKCIAPHKDTCAGDPTLQAIEYMCSGGVAGGAGGGPTPNIPNMCAVDVCAVGMQQYQPKSFGEPIEATPELCEAVSQYKTCVEQGRSQCPDSQRVTNAEMMIKSFELLCGGLNDKVTSTPSSYTKETEGSLKRGSNSRRIMAELKKENLILDNERLREETKRLKLVQENLRLEKEVFILKKRCLICKLQSEYPDCVEP